MTVTVIGSRGFVGARLVQRLQRDGVSPRTPDHRDRAAFDREVLGLELGTVYYCAGLTADYAKRPFDTVEAHASLISRLTERASFDRLVYLSSTRLYDSLGGVKATEELPFNFSPHNPRHIYDLSKALGESVCLTASQGRARVARLSCVYDTAPDAPGFLPELLARLTRERAFSLPSSPDAVRDYVHVDDVVAALLAIASGDEPGAFNVGSGENVSNADIMATLNRLGWQVTLTGAALNAPAPIIDIAKLKRLHVSPRRLLPFLTEHLKSAPRQ